MTYNVFQDPIGFGKEIQIEIRLEKSADLKHVFIWLVLYLKGNLGERITD